MFINALHGQRRILPSIVALILSLAAGAVVFVPFAFDTSPLDAVMFRVPGNQGNWWHLLVGAPFFLAFPMIWFRLNELISGEGAMAISHRIILVAASLSICGTLAVETPFLLHLAGTSEWQRVIVLALGFGVIIASGAVLFWRRDRLTNHRISLIALTTAYLANASICLVVYSDAAGALKSRSGWLITMIIVWPMVVELIWTYIDTFRTPVLKSAASKLG